MRKGITRRWLVNTLGIILAILITIIVVLSFVIQTFYYNGIQQTISGRSNELVNFFGNYTAADTGCLLYTSPSPRDRTRSRMPSSA